MFTLPIKILEKQKLAAAAASVTFSTIGTKKDAWDAVAQVTSRHLVLIINAASSQAADDVDVELQFNGDSGANYNDQYLLGVDVADSANVASGQTAMTIGKVPAANVANAFGGGQIVIPHAFGTTNHKTLVSQTGSGEYAVVAVAGRWASAAAITSIVLTPSAGNFVAESVFLLGVVDERYLIEEDSLAADGTPFFEGIPQLEGDLVLVGYARSDQAAVSDEVVHTINGDTTAGNYPSQEVTGIAAVTGAAQPNQECGIVTGDNATALTFGALVLAYSQYIKDNQPHFTSLSGFHETSGVTSEVRAMSGRKSNIEPINMLALAPNAGTDFKAGSLFSLYLVPKRLIERQELTAAAATVTFASIPDDFEALVLHVYARSDEAALGDEVEIEINDDNTADNYDFQEVTGAVGAVAAVRNLSSQQLLYIPANTEGTNEFGGGSVLIPAYAETDRHKHLIAIDGQQENRVAISSHRWEATAAITKIDLTVVGGTNFMAGSVFELEGVLAKAGLPAEVGMRFGV